MKIKVIILHWNVIGYKLEVNVKNENVTEKTIKKVKISL